MIPETIYSKYSQAMFDIAREQQQLDAFGTELKGVRDVFQEMVICGNSSIIRSYHLSPKRYIE